MLTYRLSGRLSWHGLNRSGSDIDVRGGVRDYAIATEHAVRMWALSVELTGVDAFAV